MSSRYTTRPRAKDADPEKWGASGKASRPRVAGVLPRLPSVTPILPETVLERCKAAFAEHNRMVADLLERKQSPVAGQQAAQQGSNKGATRGRNTPGTPVADVIPALITADVARTWEQVWGFFGEELIIQMHTMPGELGRQYQVQGSALVVATNAHAKTVQAHLDVLEPLLWFKYTWKHGFVDFRFTFKFEQLCQK